MHSIQYFIISFDIREYQYSFSSNLFFATIGMLLIILYLFVFSCDNDNSVGPNECIDGDEVELWGLCINIYDTIEFNASVLGLEELGEIPPEIGELINLTHPSFLD